MNISQAFEYISQSDDIDFILSFGKLDLVVQRKLPHGTLVISQVNCEFSMTNPFEEFVGLNDWTPNYLDLTTDSWEVTGWSEDSPMKSDELPTVKVLTGDHKGKYVQVLYTNGATVTVGITVGNVIQPLQYNINQLAGVAGLHVSQVY